MVLNGLWTMATSYVGNVDYGCLSLTGDARVLALNLMTAHLAWLSDKIGKGETPGLEQSATIDKVSVSLTPPPVKTQFQWWLTLSPYGAQLQALLGVKGAGGFYVPSSAGPGRTGFRNAIGGF